MQKSEFTFYKPDSPRDTLTTYLDSHDNLYDQTRVAVTRKFLLEHLPLNSMNVLDIGCGGGIWSAFFAARVSYLTCCDIRAHVLEAAKLYVSEKVEEDRLSRIDWVTCEPTAAEFPRKFNFVFAKDVIEHVKDDLGFMNDLNAMLDTDGYAYIATQNSRSLNFLIEGAYQRAIGNKDWCGWDPTHERFYNARSLESVARKSRFSVVAWHGMYHFPYRFLSRLVLRRLVEHPCFHIGERRAGTRWPWSKTGWAIGVLLRKESR